MIITHGRTFKKMFKKQSLLVQDQFEERMLLFIKNIHNPILGNHKLNGEWVGCRSINITGDIRVVYREMNDEAVELVAIGSHSELYS